MSTRPGSSPDVMSGFSSRGGLRARSRPLRISVLGSSVGFYVRPPGPGPARPYPEQLEELLLGDGLDVEVYNHSVWFRMVHEALADIQAAVVTRGADVVIINFGLLEAESTLLPTGLVRSVYSWQPSTSPLWGPLRHRLIRPVELFHRSVEPRIMRHGLAFHRLSPARFEKELTRMVDWLRKERKALVLVLNINPVGDNVERGLPGTRVSVRRYNRILEELVDSRADSGLRLVDVAGAVSQAGTARTVPDGIHYSAEGHRLVAGLLAEEVRDWVASEIPDRPPGITQGQWACRRPLS